MNANVDREIKFRAWDGERMTSPFELGSINAGDGFDPRWKVMQFTGLHDRNGKEIYEGDIIRMAEDGWEGKTVATWIAGWGFSFSDGECPLKNIDVYEFYEVIGDVYHNTELLK